MIATCCNLFRLKLLILRKLLAQLRTTSTKGRQNQDIIRTESSSESSERNLRARDYSVSY